jgi:hypothetical protein
MGEQSVCPELLYVIGMEEWQGYTLLAGVPLDSCVARFFATLLSMAQQKSSYWSNGIPLMPHE